MEHEVRADDGCLLWAEMAGTGLPLVLCHGGPGLWDYFDGVAELLGDLGRVVRWDQRGCGRSERREPYTVARFVADVDAVRQHCGIERISLLGHSWGALLALRYTLEHPDRVGCLIYVSGTGIDPEHTWKTTFHRDIERRIGVDAARWKELGSRQRTPDGDREHAILQWTADFVDRSTARQHAERLGTPWLGINYECADSINAEVKEYLQDHDVAARCRALTVPTLSSSTATGTFDRDGQSTRWPRACRRSSASPSPAPVTCRGPRTQPVSARRWPASWTRTASFGASTPHDRRTPYPWGMMAR